MAKFNQGEHYRKFIESQPYDKLPPEFKTKPEDGAKNKLFTDEVLRKLQKISEERAAEKKMESFGTFTERMFGPNAFSFGIPHTTMYEPSFTMPPQHENARCTTTTPCDHKFPAGGGGLCAKCGLSYYRAVKGGYSRRNDGRSSNPTCERDGHVWVSGMCARCGIGRVEASQTCEHDFDHGSRVCRKCGITAREAAYQSETKRHAERAAGYVPNPDPSSYSFSAEEFGKLVEEQLDGLVHIVQLCVDRNGMIEAKMFFDSKRPRAMELSEAITEIDLFMSQFEELGVTWKPIIKANWSGMKAEVIP